MGKRFRTRILFDQDNLAGKHTFDDVAFGVDGQGRLEVNDDDKEVLEEAMFLAASEAARGLPGFSGSMGHGSRYLPRSLQRSP